MQKEELAAVKQDVLPGFSIMFEKFLKQNGTGYYVGDSVIFLNFIILLTTEICKLQLTWADLWVAELFERMLSLDSSVFDDYPLISKHVSMISSMPNIKAWIEKRPVTLF